MEEHACDPRVKCSWDESKIDSFITKFRERYNSQYDRILFTINENVEDASNMFIELFCSAAVQGQIEIVLPVNHGGLVGWFCCFTSKVNSYGHCGTVSSPNHTFSWAGLNKRLTSNLCTYFRLSLLE